MSRVKVRVRDGRAVFDGETQRGAGDELKVPADVAGRWNIAGWVEPVETVKAKRKRP